LIPTQSFFQNSYPHQCILRAVAVLQSSGHTTLTKNWVPAFFRLVSPDPELSDTLRPITFTTILEHTAPGLLRRTIFRRKDPKICTVLKVIAQTEPNILALQSFDWDA